MPYILPYAAAARRTGIVKFNTYVALGFLSPYLVLNVINMVKLSHTVYINNPLVSQMVRMRKQVHLILVNINTIKNILISPLFTANF